jgi:CRISPR-associated endonuclease/helicase Cas3
VGVVLKFHPRVAHRVRETRWHRSEQVEEQPDGSLLWRARVAEVQEMLPWIRGWGPTWRFWLRRNSARR